MITYFTMDLPMIYKHCPENQTEETCPLRSYLNSDESVFSILSFTHQLGRKTQDWPTVRDAVDKMHAMCNECMNKNLQHTK